MLKKGDGSKYNLWSDSKDYELDLKNYSKIILEKKYKISHIIKQERKGKPVFIIDSKNGGVDYLAIRKVDSNLRKIYKVKQADRSAIVRQLLTILEDGSPMYLLKLDIKSFYESIDPEILLNKIKRDQMISKKTETILQSLFNHRKIKKIDGLPRGISISATLSELYMREIDRAIRNFNGVYFYSRFVDDIVIISFDKENKVLRQLKQYLRQNKLSLNDSKQQELELDGKKNTVLGGFSYLGYRFEITRKQVNNINIMLNKISVYIADVKMTKIRNRIVKVFLDYFKNSDFVLLKNRLKFLTGNCAIDKNKNGTLMVGNFYNYPELTDMSMLKKIDEFLYSLLKNKNGNVGRKISKVLNNTQIDKLLSYSFVYGYNKGGKGPLVFNFSQKQIYKLTMCWKYE
jgi:hypothetical protein